jgi:hypothetical protein
VVLVVPVGLLDEEHEGLEVALVFCLGLDWGRREAGVSEGRDGARERERARVDGGGGGRGRARDRSAALMMMMPEVVVVGTTHGRARASHIMNLRALKGGGGGGQAGAHGRGEEASLFSLSPSPTRAKERDSQQVLRGRRQDESRRDVVDDILRRGRHLGESWKRVYNRVFGCSLSSFPRVPLCWSSFREAQ